MIIFLSILRLFDEFAGLCANVLKSGDLLQGVIFWGDILCDLGLVIKGLAGFVSME